MFKTRITELFDLRYPVMSAPMSMHSGGRLAGAVTQAGGLGLFGGTNPAGDDWLRDEIGRARKLCGDRPFGVGFITHLIPVFPSLFDVALAERVPVLAFSFDDPAPWCARAKDVGATVICQVQSAQRAAEAIAAGADILVAQGNEAGGHTGRAKLMPLLAHLLREYPDVPILAAGGIASGAALARVLAAGADGAWLGTALLATPECVEVPPSYKERIIQARSEDTIYTEVFDLLDEAAYGIPPWPEGIAARTIRNQFTADWHGKEAELGAEIARVLPLYLGALEAHDVSKMAVYAGESVDFVQAIRPAAEVITDICEEAKRLLAGAARG